MTDILITASYVARKLGVTPAAVSNWLARGVLTGSLKPVSAAWSGPDKNIFLWQKSQLVLFREWHESKPEYVRERGGTSKD